MIPLMLVVLSLGCFRAGTLLQLYRVHLIVHARRLCQKLPTLPTASVRENNIYSIRFVLRFMTSDNDDRKIHY